MLVDADFDVMIVGAGPAGSTAAIMLAQAGWRVAVIEKQNFPRRKVCGECIAPSNLPLLDAMGIGEAVRLLAGPPLRCIALMVGDQTIHADFPRYEGLHSWGVALGREYLDTLLLDQAKKLGVSVFQPWTATKLQGDWHGHRCRVKKIHSHDTMVLAAPILIDAHGSWEQSKISDGEQARRVREDDLLAFKANFTQGGLDTGVLPVFAFPGGYGGMVVGDHATTTLAFCIRRDRLTRCRRSSRAGMLAAEAALNHVAGSCLGVHAMLKGAQRNGTWLAAGPLRPGIHMGRQAPGVFVVGNAAGEAHPIIGEGMSMAFQSAALLASMLAPHFAKRNDATFLHTLQRDYARAWRAHFVSRIRLAAVFAQVAMRPEWVGWILPLLKRYPQLLTQAARWSDKVRDAPTIASTMMSAVGDPIS